MKHCQKHNRPNALSLSVRTCFANVCVHIRLCLCLRLCMFFFIGNYVYMCFVCLCFCLCVASDRGWDFSGCGELILIVSKLHICHGYHGSYLWRKFCHVEKFQIFVKNLNNLWRFIEIYAVFVLDLCGEKSVWRKSLWRKNDEFEVCGDGDGHDDV